MNPKLKGYADAIRAGRLTDAQIARTAKATEAEVAAARVELSPVPVVAPVVDAVPVADVAAWNVLPVAADSPSELLAAVADVVAPAAADEAPATVRVTVTRDIAGPKGKHLHLGFRAVYGGEMAAWLWANHRALVEQYPPVKA